jgi:hypothetical protein
MQDMKKPKGMREEQWEKLQIVLNYFKDYTYKAVSIEFPPISRTVNTWIGEVGHQKVSDSEWKEKDENGKSKQQFFITLVNGVEQNKIIVNIDDIGIVIEDGELIIRAIKENSPVMRITEVTRKD